METSHEVVTQVKAENVKVVRKGETMRDILELVSTEFVFLADDLDVVTNWTNIERGVSRVILRSQKRSYNDGHKIRLLSSGWMGVSAVGGAVRNSSGHWHIGCTQVSSVQDCLQTSSPVLGRDLLLPAGAEARLPAAVQ